MKPDSELSKFFDPREPSDGTRYDVNDDDYETIAEDEAWKVQVHKNPDSFGSKSQARRLSIQTGFPKVPEHIRPLLDRWEELHGYGVVPKKQLVNSAYCYHECVNGSVPLLARVYEYMKSKGLFRKDLGSLITIAVDWKDEVEPGSEEELQEYAKGWEER